MSLCEENLQRRGMMCVWGGGTDLLAAYILLQLHQNLVWIGFFCIFLFLYFVLETDLLVAYMLLQLYLRSNLDFPHFCIFL